jgi:HK97 family phage prohead protease
MMNKIFNIVSSFKTIEKEDATIYISGMASTKDQDRAGDVIEAEAWAKGGLLNFTKNPIILFNHNYDKPIGKATNLEVIDGGLRLEALISKSAPDGVAELIKEGILGAFSVGFRVKDADYIEETGGLKIKDAELFEVSVVSVPCNQAATFSLAKSFDSESEYEDFKKTFTNRVDLAGQPLAKEEGNPSSVASDTPDVEPTGSQKMEIKMSDNDNQIDLEAFAKQVAEETAAKIAMKLAEEKAADKKAVEAAEKAAAEKAAAEEAVKTTIKTGIESGAERLQKDFAEALASEKADMGQVIAKFEADLREKEEELNQMRESKSIFADRSGTEQDRLEKNSKELWQAHLLGVITGKGFNTEYGQSVLEKAGSSYTSGTDHGLDNVVSMQIEKEIQLQLRLASNFSEFPVESHSTVIPLQTDTNFAKWNGGTTPADYASAVDFADNGSGTGITNRQADDVYNGAGDGTYNVQQKVVTVDRLLSSSYLDNILDEKVLVNIMPMLTEGVARSHARAVDRAIIRGNGAGNSITGIGGLSGINGLAIDSNVVYGVNGGTAPLNVDVLSGLALVKMRKDMGVYGLDPQDVFYLVSQSRYYDLLEDPDFQTIDEVGSDVATRLVGQVGSVFGSPVVISDNVNAEVENAFGGAFAIYRKNFVIPRLRGVTVEQDYEVSNQRRVIVATQHLGFDELFDSVAGKAAATYITRDFAA